MNVQFEADDQRINDFLTNLGLPQAERPADAAKVSALALNFLLEWGLNERRFDRSNQWTEHWIAQIEDAFFPNEEPEATKLYGRYALSLPRAQFLARMLLARRTAQWRARSRQELRAKLEEVHADAQAAVAANNRSQEFEIILSRGAFDEFLSSYNTVFAWPKTPLAQPRRQSSFRSQVSLKIIADP